MEYIAVGKTNEKVQRPSWRTYTKEKRETVGTDIQQEQLQEEQKMT
jgi:hypothetical protein